MRRTATVLAVLAVAPAALAGCGGDGGGAQAARGAAPVQLRVSEPSDLTSTRSSTLTVAGSVSPAGADVRVLGRAAEVVGGSFTARVPLRPGANVIDLFATARGHDPALTALRVTREVAITVPDLTHLTPDAARSRVARLGLRLRTENGGGLFEPIIPGTPGVCTQDPKPGAHVQRGAAITVLVAKRC